MQEKYNSVDVQKSRVNITGFIYIVARKPLRLSTFGEFESLAVA